MRIERVPPLVGPALLSAAAERRTAADFAAEAAPAPPPHGTTLTPPATSVEMLVALAAVDPAVERRRKLAAEAERGLALLERLYQDRLGDDVVPERLAALATWAERFVVPEDPDLASVARDIELRVKVELARHDMKA